MNSSGSWQQRAIVRWLSHWSFWPTYLLILLITLWALQPWAGWFGEDSRFGTQAVWVRSSIDPTISYSIGTVVLARGDVAPSKDWLPCDGRKLDIAGNELLHEQIGDLFGGDGTTFRLPDFRGLAWTKRLAESRDGIVGTLHLTDGERRESEEDRRLLVFWIRAR